MLYFGDTGDLVLRIPEHLIITLDRVFEDEVGFCPPFFACCGNTRIRGVQLCILMGSYYMSLHLERPG